jgi:aspartyl-tRNA(Asn)/glutamyl-tRNA(Gln) amidotransferase subunit A
MAERCVQLAKMNKFNAFVSVVEREQVLNKAKESDLRKKQNTLKSKIDGVVFSLKDTYCTKDVKTTMASKMLDDFIPRYNATILDKLLNAGGIMVGKTNMDEFAMGSGTTFSTFGPTKNPAFEHETYIAGGSSGGSAASVAEKSSELYVTCTQLTNSSIGTDTGGSVRQPASYCGIVGFKPGYGSCSRYGMISHASSLDTVGILAKSVRDAGIVYDIIRGKDENDTTSHDDGAQYQQQNNQTPVRVAIPVEYFVDELSDDIIKVWQDAITLLKEKHNAQVEYVSLPHTKYALSAYYVISSAEASSNLGRYDGIRYGGVEKEKSTMSLKDKYLLNRSEGFGEEVKRRIISGTFALSIEYF